MPMLYRLTFKKAFGVETIPVEVCSWMLDFVHSKGFKFSIGNTEFTFNVGSFEESQHEKIILSYARHADDRDITYISRISTMNISFKVDVTINDSIHDQGIINYNANGIIEPFIPLALEAVSMVVDAYRIVKYDVKRMSP